MDCWNFSFSDFGLSWIVTDPTHRKLLNQQFFRHDGIENKTRHVTQYQPAIFGITIWQPRKDRTVSIDLFGLLYQDVKPTLQQPSGGTSQFLLRVGVTWVCYTLGSLS